MFRIYGYLSGKQCHSAFRVGWRILEVVHNVHIMASKLELNARVDLVHSRAIHI